MAIYLKKCFNFYEKCLGVSLIIDIMIINLKILRKKWQYSKQKLKNFFTFMKISQTMSWL